MDAKFSHQIIKWFDRFGRHHLPWQKNISPYRVWISEIMLQQTQVATVIPYYNRFMKRFPNIKTLALANIDDVLSHWSGLGYYARARNLHRAAQILHEKYHGHFPKTIDGLSELPGIGRSTAGAILSLGMHIPAPILEGNVKRVFARHFAIETPLNQAMTQKKLWELSENLIPKKRCWDYNQAMMDLGSMVCTRSKPKCTLCPIKKTCRAFSLRRPTAYPKKEIKIERPQKAIRMLILQNESGAVLLEKRPPIGIWGGLWSFPECPINADMKQWCHEQFQAKVFPIVELNSIIHQFSHFELEIKPTVLRIQPLRCVIMDTSNRIWYKINSILPGGIAAPISRLITQLRSEIR